MFTHPLFQKLFAEPEIRQHHMSLDVKEYVFQFDISVYNPQLYVTYEILIS